MALSMDTHPYWSSLPLGLLHMIIDRLQFADQVRFAAVCTWWRNAAGDSTHLPALQFPWLLLPKDPPTTTWDLFTPTDDVGARIRHLEIPWASGCRCFGSSNGWLFMAHDDHGIRLLNPFTNTHYPLPHGSTIPTFDGQPPNAVNLQRISSRGYFYKAILSSVPTPQTVVAALCGSGGLVTCRLGDVEWVKHGIDDVEDFIFLDGRLYCLTEEAQTVAVYEFSPHFRLKEIYRSSHNKLREVAHFKGDANEARFYLVGGRGGELLAVVRHWDENPVQDPYFKSTLGFSVLKLDRRSAPRWVEVDSLGDEMIFIGTASSACFAAGGGFRRNCIYFTDDRPGMWISSTCTLHTDCDWGEYCLDDDTFHRFPLDNSYTTESPPIWYLLHD